MNRRNDGDLYGNMKRAYQLGVTSIATLNTTQQGDERRLQYGCEKLLSTIGLTWSILLTIFLGSIGRGFV